MDGDFGRIVEFEDRVQLSVQETVAVQAPLVGVTRKNIVRELSAGITLIAIAIPLNIGYSQIAGLPATAGLYALVVPTIVYALIVSSRQLVASPDAAAAALVASSIGGLAVAGSENYAAMALAQAIISGVLLIAMSVLKLGFLANFLSKPILVGFVGGLALDILVSQCAKMLGIKIDSGGEFVEKLAGLITGLPETNLVSLMISVGVVLVLIGGRKLLPQVPWALIAMIITTVIVALTHADRAGVSVLGPVPSGPPPLTWPQLEWLDWLALVPSAIALTMVTAAEGLLVSRSYGERRGYPTQPDRDLLAFGVGNCAAGLSGAFVMGSSTSRTAAMDQVGSRTQLPSIVLAVGTLLLLLFGTSLLAEIPSPTIGAIVGVAVIPLLGVRDFMSIAKKDRFELAIGAVCFLVTLLIGSIPGILVAFVLALINLAKRSASPAIDVLAANDNPSESLLESAPRGQVTAPGVIVIRMAAPIFFANSNEFSQAVKGAVTAAKQNGDHVHSVVIDMEAVTDVDVTAAESMETLREWLDQNDLRLAFSRVRDNAKPRLHRMGILRGSDAVYDTNRAAVSSVSNSDLA